MNNASSKKFTTNPKRATSSDTPGKREQLVNEMEKNCLRQLIFQILGFSIIKYIKTKKTCCKGITYALPKAGHSAAFQKIGVLQVQESILF